MISSLLETAYQLSPMQQGMLFHHRMESGAGVDIEQMIGAFHEALDIDAFRKAWEAVVSRHHALRTSFHWEGLEEPLQRVHSGVPLPFVFEDWQNLAADKQEQGLAEYLKQDRAKGFDVSEAPLMRVALFRMGATEYRAVWTFHHIIMDGRSHPLVLSEVFARYEAGREGRDPGLTQPRQYQEYIEWLEQQDHAKSETFWRGYLEGFTAPTPVDTIPRTGRPGADDVENGEAEIELSEAVTTSLRAVARNRQLSLRTLVQGAWALLLSRYTGEHDVVFGEVRACRRDTIPDADSVVGLFINTLPVRVRFSSDQHLTVSLKTLREQDIAARNHEHTPLVQIQGWSDVRQGAPLFESVFVFDTYRLNSLLREQGEQWRQREFSLLEKTGFPLALSAFADKGLLLKMSYEKRRFDDAAVRQMLGNLAVILEGMAENIDRPPSQLPILTREERHRLLTVWNGKVADFPREACLHELLEAQAARTPDNVAVVFEGNGLTYRELNRRANQLAQYLRGRGVGPDVLVGVFMERSLEMVVGIYGILKAGGAFVPLDPDYPPDRLAYMITDMQAPVLLTQEHLVAKVPENAAEIVCLDSDWAGIAMEQSGNFSSGATADNLVHVIYTSGSTGMPKGVMVTHRGICNFLLCLQDLYPLSSGDRLLHKSPLSFDAIYMELFRPWLAGARLIVARPGGHKDNQYLIRMVREHAITEIFFVPSMLQIFLDEKDVDHCTTLKQFFCGGEALPHETQERFFSRFSAELNNLYGPTEASVVVTYWHCKQDDDRRVIPIGYPFANTQIYIVDAHLQPAPVGVAGELCVGGVQVARGYLNRPELTAEKFVADPFSAIPGARMYRTGDMARYLPRGEIEFLGRTDHQVKIRGFRIELGEIEAALGGHAAVSQALVMAREDIPGERQLVAYIVPDGSPVPSHNEMRRYLKERLPEYMVPGAFVVLDRFPSTPSGKIDRKQLPAPASCDRQAASDYVAPRTEIERLITTIWQGVLRIEKIGVHDNFFDLGGHSLRLAQVHSRLREKLQRDVTMLELFKYPTIDSLARHLSRGEEEPILSEKTDDRIEKLKEGKNRVKRRFSHRERTDQMERRLRDE